MTTKKRFSLAWLIVAALPLAAAACHSNDAAAPPGDMSASQAKAAIGEVTVGHQAGADGQIAADQKGRDFTPGQPVVIAFKIGKAPAGTTVHIDWVGPNGEALGSDDKIATNGQSNMSFTSKDTTAWGKGDYHADILVANQKVDTEKFGIVDASKNEATATKPKNAISDVTVGHRLGADGTIAAEEKGKNFIPGQTVFIAFKAGDSPTGTSVHIAWVGPNGQDLGSEDKQVSAGQTNMHFEARKTGEWGLGDYHADLSVGSDKVDTENFSIVNANKADKPLK